MDPSTKPNASEDFAKNLIKDFYGFEAVQVKKMISFFDQNFHIKVSKTHNNPHVREICETGYVLKIVNSGTSAINDYYNPIISILNHLQHHKGINAPVPVANLKGNVLQYDKIPLLKENNEANSRCVFLLLTYIEGVNVHTVDYTTDVLFQWGYLLAKFNNAVQDLDLPELKDKNLFWSLERFPEVENFLEGLDTRKLKLARHVLDKYSQEITPEIYSQLSKGIIHGDFNESNVLARKITTDDGNIRYIVDGILDFDHVSYKTYVWEIGMMLAYAMLDCKTMDPLEGAGHVLAGYLSLRSLSELEMSLLKTCMQARLCQSTVVGEYSYRQDPSNEYLKWSSRSGWEMQELLLKIENRDLLNKWQNINNQHIANRTLDKFL